MSSEHHSLVRPEFDPHTESYCVTHDSTSPMSVSTTLVLSLASLTDREPTQMPSLGRTLDPETLEAHVRDGDEGVCLSFDFLGFSVTVRDDGRIEFEPRDERCV